MKSYQLQNSLLQFYLELPHKQRQRGEAVGWSMSPVDLDIESNVRRFRAFFEQAFLPMTIFSSRGDCLAANAAWEETFQTTTAELVDYNIFTDTQSQTKGLVDFFSRALTGKHVAVPTFYYDPGAIQKKGRPRWLEAYLFPVQNLSRQVDEVAIILKDVTGLQEALNARDDFLSIASHELRTPLTPMKMQMQALTRLLKAPYGGDVDLAKIGQVVENSERQLQRLVRLIDNLFDVSRINAGRMSMKFERVNIVGLVQEVCQRYAEGMITFTAQVPGHEKEVFGFWDRLRIDQVLVNLMSNAVKYAPGAPIHVVVERRKANVLIQVIDQGPGINPENLNRIFERYERANNNHQVGGLGLGLYIAREIVEAHNGRLWAESVVGKGSTFLLELPL